MTKFLLLIIVLFVPVSSVNAWDLLGYVNGEVTGDQMGSALAEIDFDGDGYRDLAIGASAADPAGTSSGAVYILFGGPDADLVADTTLVGTASSFFGKALANIGDVNDDGFDDLAVGAPFYDDPAPNAGAVYVFFCGPGADTTVDLLLTGEAASDYFGTAVCAAGDFNNDSYDDIAVGAYRADWSSFADAGKVYLYYGGPSIDNAADGTLVGETDGERFGYALSAADFDLDGVPSLAVGAYSFDSQDLNVGRIYIFDGGIGYDTLVDHRISGSLPGEKQGWSLSAGLITADNYPDLVMGSDGYSVSNFETGKVYIYAGSAVFDTVLDDSFTLGRAADDFLGYAVAAGTDIDADGHGEVIAGAPGYDDGALDAGAVLLLDAQGDALGIDTTFEEVESSAEMGEAVAFWSGYGQAHEGAIVFGATGFDSFRGRVTVYTIAGAQQNQRPEVTYTGQTQVPYEDSVVLSVSGTDPDGTTPDLFAYGLPTDAVFADSGNGAGGFYWLTTQSDVGVHSIVLSASDGELADSLHVDLLVTDTANCCVGIRGNINNDSEDQANITDVTYMVAYLFGDGAPPACPEEADLNADGTLNISDLTYFVNYLFGSGTEPQPCD